MRFALGLPIFVRSVAMRIAFLLLAGMLALQGCMPPPPPPERGRERERDRERREVGEGRGGRRQPLALDPKRELAVGRQAQAEMKQEYRGRILPADSAPARRA